MTMPRRTAFKLMLFGAASWLARAPGRAAEQNGAASGQEVRSYGVDVGLVRLSVTARTPGGTLIHDLEAKIESIRQRAAARSVKKSPTMKHTVAAVRAIDKALESAATENNTTLRHSLADAREPLVAYLQLEGIKLPKTRRPKGPRPK